MARRSPFFPERVPHFHEHSTTRTPRPDRRTIPPSSTIRQCSSPAERRFWRLGQTGCDSRFGDYYPIAWFFPYKEWTAVGSDDGPHFSTMRHAIQKHQIIGLT